MKRALRFILVQLLLVAAWIYINHAADAVTPAGRPLDEFPASYGEWRMTSRFRFSEAVLDTLKPTEYLYRNYAGPEGKKIGLYIGYHDGGRESGEIHSPRHCLPGSGWQEITSARMELATPQGKINLVKAAYQKGESRELFLYWFQVRGRSITNEYSLKLAEITGSIVNRRRDAAFIRVSIPFDGDEESAMEAGVRFIREFHPLIRDFIPS